MMNIDVKSLLSLALLLAGVGHFVVLIASVQVPTRFQWKSDFAKLTPFNRKLVWVYAIYTFMTILAFGTLTLLFRNEFLEGNSVALGLAVFIGSFWGGRILIDLFSFGHRDWPQGAKFIFLHICLTFLFLALSATYFSVVLWHFLK